MTERSVDHGRFTIEPTYDVSPAQVFAAWADRGKGPLFQGPRGLGQRFPRARLPGRRARGGERRTRGRTGPRIPSDLLGHRPRRAHRLHLRDADERDAGLGLVAHDRAQAGRRGNAAEPDRVPAPSSTVTIRPLGAHRARGRYWTRLPRHCKAIPGVPDRAVSVLSGVGDDVSRAATSRASERLRSRA